MITTFKDWLEATSVETLEKLAEQEQDSLVGKVVEAMIPLMEKQAEYAAYLVLTKLAEEEMAVEEQGLPAQPASGSKDNTTVNPPTKSQPGIQVNEIKGAIEEAVAAQQVAKIVPFVKAIASNQPDALEDVIKIVKVELQDACMKNMLSAEEAAQVAQELNNVVEGGGQE